MDADHVGISQQIVQIAESLLVCPYQEDSQIILFILLQFMQMQGLALVVQIDELLDFAIAIASDVGDDGVSGRSFIEPMNRHNRKDLLDRPGVRQGLEYAEISVVDIGQSFIQAFKFIRDVL